MIDLHVGLLFEKPNKCNDAELNDLFEGGGGAGFTLICCINASATYAFKAIGLYPQLQSSLFQDVDS